MKKLVSEGVVEDFYFMMEPSFQHFLPCPNMVQLWKSLNDWARKHNLIPTGNTNWCLKSAFHTLDCWARTSSTYDMVGLLYHDAYEALPRLEPLKVPDGFDEWQPDFEEREDYLRNFLTKFRAEMNDVDAFRDRKLAAQFINLARNRAEEYCDRLAQHYRSNGWKKVRDKKKFSEHLNWAVKFQVAGDSFTSIAEANDVSVPTVKKEVEKVLNMIALVRRTDVHRGPRAGRRQSIRAGILRSLAR
ncbi:MAG TPA: hypothetical protein VMZ30_13260 [Pyrinomonadaceae bacterium]|nr:hypothetical protein [Pyrinomonadaceae bacterium]